VNTSVSLEARGVTKKHCRSLKRAMLYGIQDITRDILNIAPPLNLRRDEFWAVQDVSFTIKRGECMGIIGPNGAGKSTLLKILNGIFRPDAGKIEFQGRMGALIGVGAGFHPLLTARENIYISASILGLSKKEIDKGLDEIIAFAELEQYVEVPVKHYSSGMYMRLAFSTSAYVAPEIMLVDEALAVGDIGFQRKCMNKMRSYISNGGSLLLVTHDMLALNSLCTNCLVLSAGKVVYQGDVSGGVDCYVKETTYGMNNSTSEYTLLPNEIRYGSKECELVSLEFIQGEKNESGNIDTLISGHSTRASLKIKVNETTKKVHVGISVWDTSGIALLTLNTIGQDISSIPLHEGKTVEYTFEFDCLLNTGRYLVGAGIFNPDTGHFFDRRLQWKMVNVISYKKDMGIFMIPYKINITTLNQD
jgi:lipopolysaccharide transport system ATP-binding protein